MSAPTLALPPVEQIADTLSWPFEAWAHQCHAVSIAFVKRGIVPAGSRVARGTARGIGGQHSWVVVQTDGSGELADCGHRDGRHDVTVAPSAALAKAWAAGYDAGDLDSSVQRTLAMGYELAEGQSPELTRNPYA